MCCNPDLNLLEVELLSCHTWYQFTPQSHCQQPPPANLISVTVADLVQQLSTKTTCQSLPLTDGTAFIPNLQPALNLHEFLYYIHEALTSCEIQLNYVKSRCLESQAPKTTSRIAVLVMVSKLALGFRSFHICCNCKCCRDSSCCKWVGWQWV